MDLKKYDSDMLVLSISVTLATCYFEWLFTHSVVMRAP